MRDRRVPVALRDDRPGDVLDERALVLEAHRCDVDAKALDVLESRDLASPESIRGVQQMHSFLAGDAGERPLECAAPARAHFDHRNEWPASRNEIDLERAQSKVAKEYRVPVRVQIIGDGVLRPPSERVA